jgi:hypothetical protein
MADLLDLEAPADAVHDVMGGAPGGLVHDQGTVERGG